jgi:hypothetical protein
LHFFYFLLLCFYCLVQFILCSRIVLPLLFLVF